jgi:hypothetical protein
MFRLYKLAVIRPVFYEQLTCCVWLFIQFTPFVCAPGEARWSLRASLDAVEQSKIPCLWWESNSDYKLSLSGSGRDIRKRSYCADLFYVNADENWRIALDLSEEPAWYCNSVRVGRSWDRIQVVGGARFSALVETGSGTNPAYTMGTGSIPGGKAAGAWG